MAAINSNMDILDKNKLSDVHKDITVNLDNKEESTQPVKMDNYMTLTESNVNSDDKSKTPTIPFWLDNPNILFHKDHMLEFFPIEDMSFNQKLNSITRLVILMTIITFTYTKTTTILYVGIVSLFFIYVLYRYRTNDKEKEKEGFELSPPVKDLIDVDENMKMKSVFQKPSPTNPLSNVMITDYLYDPKRKPAPPAYNEKVSADIVEQAKQMVINANPGNEDLADKLFKDLGDAYVFEQSMRPFYSTASTTIPNDQEAFSQFCYGGMISCKEGNPFACVKNNAGKWTNH